MQRGDVLKRNENVAVELDVLDVVDEAVRGENPFLVVAAEEGDLDLFPFVLAGVIVQIEVSLAG